MAHLRLSSAKVKKHFRRTKDRTQTIQSFPFPLKIQILIFSNSKIQFGMNNDQKYNDRKLSLKHFCFSIFRGPEMILYRNQRWKIFPRPLPILANGHFWTEIWTFDQFRSKSPNLESLEIFSETKFETSQNFKLKKISSRSQNQIHTVLSFFQLDF